jgi:MFS family permease
MEKQNDLQADDAGKGAPADGPVWTRGYLNWIIFAFFLVNLLATMDRTIMAVLVEPIKRELLLSDGEVGALSFAFAIFYALFGLVLGRLTDTWSRGKLLSLSIALFSMATAACGLIQNFAQLFIVRVFVGTGEAGSVPSKYSLVGDMFPPHRRAAALALIQAGLGVGSMAGLILGGVLADAVGWRMTFVLFGVPGLVLALALAITVREPGRGRFEGGHAQGLVPPSLGSTLTALAANRTYVFIMLAYSVTTFAINGIGYWIPSFLVRSHGMSLTDVGLVYGTVSGASMLVGLALSAALTPRLLALERRWELWTPAGVNFLVAGCYFGLFSADSLTLALLFAGLTTFLLGLTVGPASSAIQSTVSARMRGVAVALTMFLSALVGQGLGPWAIGVASEILSQDRGAEALRQVLVVAPIVFLAGGALYLQGARTFNATRVD